MAFKIPTRSPGFSFVQDTEPSTINLKNGQSWYNPSTKETKIWDADNNVWILSFYINNYDRNNVGDRGLFAGGVNENDISYITISTPGSALRFGYLLSNNYNLASCSNGINNRALFAGGYDGSRRIEIEYITISTPGNSQYFGNLLDDNYHLAGCSNAENDRGLFSGGYNGTIIDTIQYINISNLSNAQNFGKMEFERQFLTSCSNGINNRALFAGGYNYVDVLIYQYEYTTIDKLSDSSNFGTLTKSKRYLGSCSNGIDDRAVFAGGEYYDDTDSWTESDSIEYVTISTQCNAQSFGNLLNPKQTTSGCSNATNNRGVFCDGSNNEYITISTPGNSQNFGDLAGMNNAYLTSCSNA